MLHPSLLLTRMFVLLTLPRERDERGDIPGWVMVTVMTAGLVATIWTVAGGQFQSMIEAALNKVKNHG